VHVRLDSVFSPPPPPVRLVRAPVLKTRREREVIVVVPDEQFVVPFNGRTDPRIGTVGVNVFRMRLNEVLHERLLRSRVELNETALVLVHLSRAIALASNQAKLMWDVPATW